MLPSERLGKAVETRWRRPGGAGDQATTKGPTGNVLVSMDGAGDWSFIPVAGPG